MRQRGDGLKPVGSPLRFVPPEQRAFAKRNQFVTQVGNLSGRVRGEESRLEPAPQGIRDASWEFEQPDANGGTLERIIVPLREIRAQGLEAWSICDSHR